MAAEKRRREIYSYAAHWPIYGLAASNKAGPEFSFRYAVGSFIEEYCNKVEVRCKCPLWISLGSFDMTSALLPRAAPCACQLG